jgi:hypothetical protein
MAPAPPFIGLALAPQRAVSLQQLRSGVVPLLLADRLAQDAQHDAGVFGRLRLRDALAIGYRLEERV